MKESGVPAGALLWADGSGLRKGAAQAAEILAEGDG